MATAFVSVSGANIPYSSFVALNNPPSSGVRKIETAKTILITSIQDKNNGTFKGQPPLPSGY